MKITENIFLYLLLHLIGNTVVSDIDGLKSVGNSTSSPISIHSRLMAMGIGNAHQRTPCFCMLSLSLRTMSGATGRVFHRPKWRDTEL